MIITKICLKRNIPDATIDNQYIGVDGSYYDAQPYPTNAGRACNFGTAERAVDYINLSGIRNVTVVRIDITVVETIIPCIE